MNYVHLHLIFNHVAIVGNAVSIFILLWALITKNNGMIRFALGFIIVIAIFGFVADFTGDHAEDQVKDIPAITKDAVKEHAEAADWAVKFLYITGAAAAVALYLFVKNKKPAKIFLYLTLVLAIFTSSVLFRTGYLGGLIRHPEISTMQK